MACAECCLSRIARFNQTRPAARIAEGTRPDIEQAMFERGIQVVCGQHCE